MKAYKAVATLLFATTSLMTMAQGTKLFTLEDLIPGGGTYRQTVPETAYTEWWGDKCIRLDIEECRIVDNKTDDSKTLFTLSQVNDAIGKSDHRLALAKRQILAFRLVAEKNSVERGHRP